MKVRPKPESDRLGGASQMVRRKVSGTAFSKGERVKATTTTQGMQAGQTYTVTAVRERNTPFGTFVTYELDGKHSVANLHVLATRVDANAGGNDDQPRDEQGRWT